MKIAAVQWEPKQTHQLLSVLGWCSGGAGWQTELPAKVPRHFCQHFCQHFYFTTTLDDDAIGNWQSGGGGGGDASAANKSKICHDIVRYERRGRENILKNGRCSKNGRGERWWWWISNQYWDCDECISIHLQKAEAPCKTNLKGISLLHRAVEIYTETGKQCAI